ncbi:MAG: hypothetical protein ACR2G0_04545, partial [Chthoniobacterales bacterium]
MVRGVAARLILPAAIGLALLQGGPVEAKSREVRRAKAVSASDLTVAYQTNDLGDVTAAAPRTRAVSV